MYVCMRNRHAGTNRVDICVWVTLSQRSSRSLSHSPGVVAGLTGCVERECLRMLFQIHNVETPPPPPPPPPPSPPATAGSVKKSL